MDDCLVLFLAWLERELAFVAYRPMLVMVSPLTVESGAATRPANTLLCLEACEFSINFTLFPMLMSLYPRECRILATVAFHFIQTRSWLRGSSIYVLARSSDKMIKIFTPKNSQTCHNACSCAAVSHLQYTHWWNKFGVESSSKVCARYLYQ